MAAATTVDRGGRGRGCGAPDNWVQVTVDATTIRRSRQSMQQPSGAAVIAGCGRGTGHNSIFRRGDKINLDAGHYIGDTNNILAGATTRWGRRSSN